MNLQLYPLSISFCCALLLISLLEVPVSCGKICVEAEESGNEAGVLSLLQTSLGIDNALKTPTLLDRDVGEASAEAQNLCLMSSNGTWHLAPEWLLIGAQKAATTSFWEMFHRHENVVAPIRPAGKNHKELHVFDKPWHFLNSSQNSQNDFQNGKDSWLNLYPLQDANCSPSTRLVATDATPAYSRKSTVYPVAENIKSYYQESSSLIKFGMILRDPIERIHSAFYFIGNIRECPLLSNISFKQYVVHMLSGSDPCNLLRSTDYPKQLESFFDHFSPSQFTIYTYQDIISPEKGPAHVIALWRRLGLPSADPPKAEDANPTQHASLEDDLDTDVMVSFKAFIARTVDAEAVAKVLTQKKERPILAGYDGAGDMESVAKWLTDRW